MNETITYSFSDNELTQLALYFRKNPMPIPTGLEEFLEFAENYVYGKMTIEEAENFFSTESTK